MKKLLLLLCVAVSSVATAQLPKSLLTPTTPVSMFDDYNGTMYLKMSYKESSVIDEKSGTYDAKLKYNIYTDALEYGKKTELYNLAKNLKVHARIDGDYFYYCDFKDQRGIRRNGYYVLVEMTDKYSIYKKFTLKIQDPPEKDLVSNGEIEKGSLRTITTYYIEESGVIMELPMNKKDMLATFSDKEDELKNYLKKEKIRLKKEEDLIRLVSKYNALKTIDSSPSQSLLGNNNRN